MQRLEARQLKCFSLSLWTSPGTTKTHPHPPPKRPRKSQTVGKKGKQFGWKEEMDEIDIERKGVKKGNTWHSFCEKTWTTSCQWLLDGLLNPACLSLNHQPLAQDFTFHKKIGSGNRDDMFNHWNQTSFRWRHLLLKLSLPQTPNNLGSEMAEIAMDTCFSYKGNFGGRCSSNSLAIWVGFLFLHISTAWTKVHVINDFVSFHAFQQCRYSKTLDGLVLQRNDLATRRGFTATIHPSQRKLHCW